MARSIRLSGQAEPGCASLDPALTVLYVLHIFDGFVSY